MSIRTAASPNSSIRSSSARTAISKDDSLISPTPSFSDINDEFMKFLYKNENPVVANAFEQAEQETGTKREHIAYGVVIFTALYLVVGSAAELVCNFVIGFCYPAYASISAIRSEDRDDDTHWFTYWTVYGSLSLLDFSSERIMDVFPFYWLVKALLLLYLLLPQTKGAKRFYQRVIEPILNYILGAKLSFEVFYIGTEKVDPETFYNTNMSAE